MGNGHGDLIRPASLLPPSPWLKLPVLACVGTGEKTHIVCIILRFDPFLFDPFIANLPKVMVVRRN